MNFGQMIIDGWPFLVNGMMWYRPTEVEINKLETLGNPGWNWDALVPVSTPREDRNHS